MRRSVKFAALGLFPLLLAAMIHGSATESAPRRALQQSWAWASSSASSSADGTSSASTYASSSTSASSSAWAQSSGNWQSSDGATLPTQESLQGQQSQQQASDAMGSLLSAAQGFFSGWGSNSNNGQSTQPTQSGDQQVQLTQPDQQVQQTQPQAQDHTPGAMRTSPSSSGLSSYAQQSLDRHNYYRARHTSTPGLAWSSSLESDAQAWANRCVFEHAGNVASGEGENLAWGYPDPISVIDAYYSEGAGYTYGVSQPGDWHSVGHFTQVVWKSTTELGCAAASCSNGQLFHVCRYSPPGNVQGQYAENVMPPSS